VGPPPAAPLRAAVPLDMASPTPAWADDERVVANTGRCPAMPTPGDHNAVFAPMMTLCANLDLIIDFRGPHRIPLCRPKRRGPTVCWRPPNLLPHRLSIWTIPACP